jgi:hypothetical protein
MIKKFAKTTQKSQELIEMEHTGKNYFENEFETFVTRIFMVLNGMNQQ